MGSSHPAKSPGQTLTACLIVRDESAHIDACLESLVDWVDRIVVVDTGSTDDTVERCRAHGARIDHFEWTGDFSAARNRSLEHVREGWVFIVDADERVNPELGAAMQRAIAAGKADAFTLPILSHLDEGDLLRHMALRLFKMRPEVTFEGHVHEQVEPSLRSLGATFGVIEHGHLDHLGYQAAELDRKSGRGLIATLRHHLEFDPTDTLARLHLAQAEIVCGDLQAARETALLAFRDAPNQSVEAINAVTLLAQIACQLHEPAEALRWTQVAHEAGLSNVLTEYFRAQALLDLGDGPSARDAIERTKARAWDDRLAGDFSVVTHKRYILEAQILTELGDHQEALRVVQAVAVENADASWTRGVIFERLGQIDDAMIHYFECLSTRHGLAAGKRLAALLIGRGEHAQAVHMVEEFVARHLMDADLFVLWASAAEKLGDTASILRAYRSFQENCHIDAALLLTWAKTFLGEGSVAKALICMSEALKMAPSDASVHFTAGDMLASQRLYDDAGHLYETGLRLLPDYALAWFTLGNCRAHLGLLESAIASYERALELDPDLEAARHNLSVVRSEMRVA